MPLCARRAVCFAMICHPIRMCKTKKKPAWMSLSVWFGFHYCVTDHNHHETHSISLWYLHWRDVTNSVNSLKPHISNQKVTRHVERFVCFFFFVYSLSPVVVVAAQWLLEFVAGTLFWIKILIAHMTIIFLNFGTATQMPEERLFIEVLMLMPKQTSWFESTTPSAAVADNTQSANRYVLSRRSFFHVYSSLIKCNNDDGL